MQEPVLAVISELMTNSNFVFQSMLNGATNGALYAAMALTVVVIFKTTGHLNLAQGEMAMLSAFLVWVLTGVRGWPMWAAVAAVFLLSAAFGAVCERVLVRPVGDRSEVAVLIVTLGLFLIINAVASGIWGTTPRPPLQPFPGDVTDRIILREGAPTLVLTYRAPMIWASVAVIFITLHGLLQRTRLGLAYRAVAASPASARLVGIPVERMQMLGWALAAGIGCVAAVMVSQQASSLEPNMMLNVLLYGFAAAAVGGFDSIVGAVVGGVLVGIAESLVPSMFTFIGSEFGLATALLAIFVVLLVRPAGLFGSREVQRA